MGPTASRSIRTCLFAATPISSNTDPDSCLMEIHKTMILPLTFYGYETLSPALK